MRVLALPVEHDRTTHESLGPNLIWLNVLFDTNSTNKGSISIELIHVEYSGHTDSELFHLSGLATTSPVSGTCAWSGQPSSSPPTGLP